VSYDTLLVYVTVSVQSDLILPQLQQHLFRDELQERIVDELME